MDIVIAADARRREVLGLEPVRFRPPQRIWIEPWFNALGRLFGVLTQGIPWRLRSRFYLYLCEKMEGHAPENNPDLPALAQRSVEMAQALKRLTGQWPAFLIATSHPETMGSLAWLRFELLRQGLLIANAVAGAEKPASLYRPHPQCFLAIDPYALDTVSPAVGGFYAGWMHQVYLAWDRQPSTQSWIQRRGLLRGSGYDRIAWRLLRRLRVNPVLMVLPGGLPHNARMLYAAREFIQKIRHPPRSQAGDPGLSKRAAEKRLMEILMEPVDGVRPAEEGELPSQTQRRIRELVETLGVAPESAGGILSEFAQEWKPASPGRARLFNVLIRRLAARGQPLMILPIAHRDAPPHVKIHPPWAVYRTPEGALQAAAGALADSAPLDISSFARRFRRQFSGAAAGPGPLGKAPPHE